jgi:hypothetical protein
MNQRRSVVDGRAFLTGSPLRSGYFVVTSAMGAASIALVAYLLFHYWRVLNVYIVITLAVPIGSQLLYQWLRALKYYSKIRELCSKRRTEGVLEEHSDDEALRIAVGGVTDVLFYCYGMILCSLAVIAALLAHR